MDKSEKKPTKNKNKGGRPPEDIHTRLKKIKIEMNLKNVEYLYKMGFTDEQMAGFFRITERALNNWKKLTGFSSAPKDWKEVADLEVERSLFSRAKGITYIINKSAIDKTTGQLRTWTEELYYPPDPTSMIFWLKNRKPKEWRDKVDLEHMGDLIIAFGHRQNKPKNND